MQVDEPKRFITLKSKAQKGLFCLEVRNPLPDTISPIILQRAETNFILPTSKPDRANHGIGLKSIREIVERYHGSVEVKTTDGMFDLFLYIPLPTSQT